MSRQQHRLGHHSDNKDGDGDGASFSSDTSRWSISPRAHHASEQPPSDSDSSLLNQEQQSSFISPRLQELRFKRAKINRDTRLRARNERINLPPIRTANIIHPRVHSASMNFIRELRSQVWDLQQQLREAKNENKLLKQLQHRHTMALQYFQHTESSIGQILARHNSESKAHQKLLRETRVCRDNLIRQLQTTENKLVRTNASLQHLQKLSKDQNLVEREELTQRLARANADLEEKEKKIQDMGKYLELCQASFNRQIIAENKKAIEARNMSFYLQEHIHQLNTELMYKGKEMDKQNIYSKRSSARKGKKDKIIQTEELEETVSHESSLGDDEFSGSEGGDTVDQQWNFKSESKKEPEFLVTEDFDRKENEKNIQVNEMVGGSLVYVTEQGSDYIYEDVQEIPPRSAKQTSRNLLAKSVVPEDFEDRNQESSYETSPNDEEVAGARKKKCSISRMSKSYIFKQSIENMHNGLPAYSPENSKGGFKVDILRRGVQNICMLGSKLKCTSEKKSVNESDKNIQTQKLKKVASKPST